MTVAWTSEHLGQLAIGAETSARVIEPRQIVPVIQGYYLWDFCPGMYPNGRVAKEGSNELWTALSAPVTDPASERHDLGRLRLLSRNCNDWIDHGNLLPDGFSPGSREWAGGILLDPDDNTVTLFYTAAGRAREPKPTFLQRIMQATGRLTLDAKRSRVTGWRSQGEPIVADEKIYLLANELEGEPGFIKAFRDPYYFRDPVTYMSYLLFSASSARAGTDFNGAVGIAVAGSGLIDWTLQEPLVHADGVTNELERPHVIYRDGYYYLFWSTQSWTFAPGSSGPTGLYGMVSASLHGPYEPINGSGLVLANPAEAPHQAYSWLVLDDLRVFSFVDLPDGAIDASGKGPRHPNGTFEGTVAPVLQLRLQGNQAWIDRDSRPESVP